MQRNPPPDNRPPNDADREDSAPTSTPVWDDHCRYSCLACGESLRYSERYLTNGQTGKTVCLDCIWRHQPIVYVKKKLGLIDDE